MGIVTAAPNYNWSGQYNGDVKGAIRDQLVAVALPRVPENPRILTLPSIEGKCATLFRKTWDKSTIIGIERNKMIAMASELFYERNNPSTVDAPLNRLFCCDVKNFMKGNNLFEPSDAPHLHPRRNVRRLAHIPKTNEHLNFDLAFLDYTGHLSNLCGEAFEFMKNNMTKTGVCGMTFSHPVNDDYTAEDAIQDLRRMNLNAKEVSITSYRNGTNQSDGAGSHMIFAIFEN